MSRVSISIFIVLIFILSQHPRSLEENIYIYNLLGASMKHTQTFFQKLFLKLSDCDGTFIIYNLS